MNNLFNLGADTDPRGSPNDLPFKNRKMEEGHAGAKVSFKVLKAGMRQSPIRNPNIQNPAMHVGFDFQPCPGFTECRKQSSVATGCPSGVNQSLEISTVHCRMGEGNFLNVPP